MVRSDTCMSHWVTGGTTTSEDPSKYRLESDWSSRRTNPPALQEYLSENINSEEDVDPSWVSEIGIGKLDVGQVFPVRVESHWVER